MVEFTIGMMRVRVISEKSEVVIEAETEEEARQKLAQFMADGQGGYTAEELLGRISQAIPSEPLSDWKTISLNPSYNQMDHPRYVSLK